MPQEVKMKDQPTSLQSSHFLNTYRINSEATGEIWTPLPNIIDTHEDPVSSILKMSKHDLSMDLQSLNAQPSVEIKSYYNTK